MEGKARAGALHTSMIFIPRVEELICLEGSAIEARLRVGGIRMLYNV